ncbi:hypothetical protein KIN20_004417 [Parelaphostrongylus tenuis]|uniref:Cytochrome b5 heme-binding domain-containing protein n=1 Tax=Parelaphostrongylus tenuis TaxID=148309 RepID=A0AAD5MH96_PARTN|nr:hypothetical protein KIN20_004417 [Parelaphostrongylus tenuis]
MLPSLSRLSTRTAQQSPKLLIIVRRKHNWNSGTRQTSKGCHILGTVAATTSCALGLLATDHLRVRFAYADAPPNEADLTPPKRNDLPTFKKDDVKKHGKDSERIWVTYKEGVYDVTDFVASHPGGDRILMAAGGSVEPFWALYAQHKTKEVMEILEELRIGSLDPKDMEAAEQVDESDPFSKDPKRHPALIVNQQRPFNAETPPALLMDSFRTPNDLFFHSKSSASS